jgi:hypothetical protein
LDGHGVRMENWDYALGFVEAATEVWEAVAGELDD